MNSHTTIVGVFNDRLRAQEAVRDLNALGIHDNEIGVITRDLNSLDAGRGDVSHNDAGNGGVGESKMPEGAVVGAATGASVGALWAVGIAAGVLPVIGPVIAGGFLAALLASAAGGAAAASLIGALIGMGIPEDDARHYEKEVQGGRTLITVRDTDRVAEVTDIFHHHGGYDVRTQGMVASH